MTETVYWLSNYTAFVVTNVIQCFVITMYCLYSRHSLSTEGELYPTSTVYWDKMWQLIGKRFNQQKAKRKQLWFTFVSFPPITVFLQTKQYLFSLSQSHLFWDVLDFLFCWLSRSISCSKTSTVNKMICSGNSWNHFILSAICFICFDKYNFRTCITFFFLQWMLRVLTISQYQYHNNTFSMIIVFMLLYKKLFWVFDKSLTFP